MQEVPKARPPVGWTRAEQDTVAAEWVRLTVAIIRHYSRNPSLRQKMWTRVPGTMRLRATQSTSLDQWYTATLRSLQIDRQGSASDNSSLSSVWPQVRASLRSRAESLEASERRALALLVREISTIEALAKQAHEQWKQLHPTTTTSSVETTDEEDSDDE